MGSTNQSLQVNPTGASLPADVQLEAGAALATQSHGSENVAVENDRLSPNVERILLDAIRDGVLFMLGVTTKVAENILITNFGSRTMRFQFGVDIKEIVELSWEAVGETGKRNEDTRIEQALRSAWPKSRENEWIRQYLIESDGCSPAIKAPWSSLVEVYQDDINVFDRTKSVMHENPFSAVRHRGTLYSRYESLWHSWCFAARAGVGEQWQRQNEESPYRPRGRIIFCASKGRRKGVQYFPIDVFACALSFDEPFSKPHNDRRPFEVGYSASFFSPDFRGGCNVPYDHFVKTAIHWQIRYFRPVDCSIGDDMNYLLSRRQTATIRSGAKRISLEEKRARISFRVLRGSSSLFSIFILADDCMFADTYNTDRVEGAIGSWERYGLKARERAIPITHYLFEIIRVFEKCMDAWGDALDAIDGLVHVSLNDLDNQAQVEDLMFDKSFDRSKDYFVALQLLRLMDEWIDEVVPSIKEMKENPSVERFPLCAAEAMDNFDAAIRNMKERADVVQKRVRKKQVEVNSLRDGVCLLPSYTNR
ncbi:hypothetical protein FOYG_12871 [Fusarium oxysporum NRRL 32931]|uniref:Uncharacterized protein n=1 Tax=Fusarium oxysporum NRRL 32931 TaxID=660029 RepID=W9HTV6_FUSOX|nr:hypothetical protein FOYG_12871 [Fusarium oxysporum NRRL 32931]